MARLLYSLLLALLSPFIFIYLYGIRGKKNAGYRQHFLERLGFYNKQLAQHAVVFHCASVGEVLAATPLIKAFQKTYPNEHLIVTCNTPTGRAQIKQSLGSEITLCYLPIDFYYATARFINRLQPKLLLILETELWPNLFAHAKERGCIVQVLNARLSEKSFRGYKKVAPLSKFIMQNIDVLASHNLQDAERFIALGLAPNKITVTGSIKFDIQLSDTEKAAANELKTLFAKRPVWVAGSTHPGEHEQVFSAHQKVLAVHPNALLIIAPRHPEQFAKVDELLTCSSLSHSCRSKSFDNKCQVLLADTLGELKMLFGSADVAYIGGSLIERGGHNPLEAAAFSVPILTGPHTYNFAHVYPELLALKGALVVNNSDELAASIIELFSDATKRAALGMNALDCLTRNQGAIDKTLTLISHHLQR
ncbi:lipid IV(A) 3-deoxy-D-manno-octulosonic acid transferase [Pseudoalteromonas sp. S16_S37]|uniref:lipid IV(A) 3-deoxy-D-manno-octulosonic acid transferase n=1 Tax=Pseudoalteromonas sp. S16_S37 TaxID=2720228 RepID=UPI001680F602|nr:lipid IV(A) 3-deoxy-D-manno-octulosonic acid transferase [Pseudoalteromonas sp. S16_S37]MBD1581557.1 3-deoxy-D-manno-octulosonic acid transferase [Pseudoalteromonas sp. S16_S37]